MRKELLILKNYILYFIVFIVVVFYGISHPLAWTSDGGITYEGIAYLTDSTTISIQADYDTPEGLILELEPNQTYYTRIKKLFIDVDGYNFIGGRQYQLELHFEGIQLNNNANTYKAYAWNTATNALDLCQTSYDETIMSNDAYPRWNFQCPSTTSEIVIHVYNSNDSAITTTGNFRWSYSYLWYTNQSMGSGNDSIIDNSNQNADRIIDNQNENTEKILDSQKVCQYFDKEDIVIDGKYLGLSSGSLRDNDNCGVTDYINIQKSTLKMINAYNYSILNYCFYDVNKTLITCNYSTETNSSISIPDNTTYFRATIYKPQNKPTFEICKDGNQALNDSLNDDNIGDSAQDGADFILNFNSNTFGLTSIITAPLNLIQSLSSSTCSPLQLPLPYLDNKYITLPCMTTIYSQHFGAFFTMYQTITFGIVAYWVIVRIFNQVKDFKNPEHDEIEVVDL